MKKRAKSIIALTLAASMLAGCGGAGSADKKEEPAKDEAKKSSMEGSGEFNRFGWEIPKETLKIHALEAYGNYAPQEAQRVGEENSLKYLKDEFNIEMTVDHIGGDGLEALNLALASGDYPEVILGAPYSIAQQFVKMGKAVEVTPYMDTVGKDIKEAMGEHYPLFLDDKEKLWYVPTSMGAIQELPDFTAHIRADEWKAIGSPKIETPEDYYNAINAILEKFPTTPDGEKRYALSMAEGYMRPDLFGGFWGLQRGYKIDEEGNFTHWAFTEEGEKMLKWLNQFHLDGTLDPDAFVNNYEEWAQKCAREQLVGCLGGWWITRTNGVEVWREDDPNIPDDKRFMCISFKDPDAEKAYVNGKNFYADGTCTIITDKAKDPEAIMKYINFQATDMGQALNGWGIPNGTPVGDTGRTVKFWNIDEEGNWEVDPEAKQAMIEERWNYTDAFYEEGMPWFIGNNDRWDDGVHNIWPNQMWYSENKWKQIMVENCADTIYDSTPMVLREKTDEVKIAEQGVADAWEANWAAVVQSNSDEEFDAALKTMQNALNAANVKALEKALSDNYKANMEKMNK